MLEIFIVLTDFMVTRSDRLYPHSCRDRANFLIKPDDRAGPIRFGLGKVELPENSTIHIQNITSFASFARNHCI